MEAIKSAGGAVLAIGGFIVIMMIVGMVQAGVCTVPIIGNLVSLGMFGNGC